jgi:hypothetical protein
MNTAPWPIVAQEVQLVDGEGQPCRRVEYSGPGAK